MGTGKGPSAAAEFDSPFARGGADSDGRLGGFDSPMVRSGGIDAPTAYRDLAAPKLRPGGPRELPRPYVTAPM